MARFPVKARNVLRTIEQVKREAGKFVNIVFVGPKNAGKTRLREILDSSSAETAKDFGILDWENDSVALKEEVKSADCVLIVLDVTGNLEDQVKRTKEFLGLNQSSLIIINKVDEVSDLEARLRPILLFLDQFAGKVHFVSALNDINVEDELAQEIFNIVDAKGKGIALAARVPVFRRIAASKIIHRTSAQNGLVGAVTILPGSDMPLLTANQLRMVLKLAAVYNEELTLSRLKELITVIGTGFTLRALARQLLDLIPGIGWVIKGSVAFTGTEALGQAAQKYFEKGYGRLNTEKIKEVFLNVQGGKVWRKSEKS